jgi:hypothetical protein
MARAESIRGEEAHRLLDVNLVMRDSPQQCDTRL